MTAPVSVRLRADVESPDDIDLLYWVGCCVSADDRVSSIARSVAKILDAAGVVKAPRAVLKATGARLTEMRRSGTGSFCCGGGGGHSFFESDGGRINRLRAREALATGTTTVCTACPYCLSMMEDGLRVEGADQVAVKDVAELVAALV